MRKTKPQRSARDVPALSPDDALDMLASAIGYMRQAGLAVSAGNVNGRLVLAIEGAQTISEGGVTRFIVSKAREVSN